MSREKTAIIGGTRSPQSQTLSRVELVTFFQRRQEAFDNLDATLLSIDYTPDCIVESPTAGVHEGRAAVERVFHGWFEAFKDLKVQSEDLLIDGQHVAQVLRIDGTDIGGFMGLSPSHKQVHFTAACLFEFRGRSEERRVGNG